MINAAICDDNEAMLNFLSGKISEIFTENRMSFELQTFHSGEEFLKKHKWISFAVISFVVLTGVNFYMIFELVRVIGTFGTGFFPSHF